MPIDPRRMAMTPEGRTAERLADVERRQNRGDASSFNRSVATASIDTTSAFTVVNNVGGVVSTFGSATWDVGGMWDPSAPDRLTFPKPGVYLVVGGGQFAGASGTGFRNISFDGSQIELPNARAGDSIYPSGQTTDLWLTSMLLALQEGAYVQLRAFVSGTANDTFGGALSAAYIGNYDF